MTTTGIIGMATYQTRYQWNQDWRCSPTTCPPPGTCHDQERALQPLSTETRWMCACVYVENMVKICISSLDCWKMLKWFARVLLGFCVAQSQSRFLASAPWTLLSKAQRATQLLATAELSGDLQHVSDSRICKRISCDQQARIIYPFYHSYQPGESYPLKSH